MIRNACLVNVSSVRCSRCGTRSSVVFVEADQPGVMKCTDCSRPLRPGDVKHFAHSAPPAR